MNGFVIFSSGGGYAHDSGNPFALLFQNPLDFEFPFDGTVVPVADAPGTSGDREGVYDWLLHGFRYPKEKDGARVFRNLRGKNNRPFALGPGPALVFVANDTTYGGDDSAHHADIASRPRVLIAVFPGASFSAESPKPVTRRAEEVVGRCAGTDAGDLQPFLDAVLGPGASGVIHAFDRAGMETDAFSALGALGIDTQLAAGAMGFLQFVDLHGEPRRIDTADAAFGQPDADSVYSVSIPSDLGLDVPAPEALRYAAWPQSSFAAPAGGTLTLSMAPVEPGAPPLRMVRVCMFDPTAEFQATEGGTLDVNSGLFSRNRFKLFTERNYVKVLNHGERFFRDFQTEISQLGPVNQLYMANWRANPHLHIDGSRACYGVNQWDKASLAAKEELEAFFGNTADATAVRLYLYPVTEEAFITIEGVTPTDSSAIHQSLRNHGVIDELGNILPAFNPEEVADYDLPIDTAYESHKSDIVDILKAIRDKGNGTGDYHVLFLPDACPGHVRLELCGRRYFVSKGNRTAFKLKDGLASAISVTACWKNRRDEPCLTVFSVGPYDAGITVVDNQNASAAAFRHEWFATTLTTEDPPGTLLQRQIPAADILTAIGVASNANVGVLALNLTSGGHTIAALTETSVAIPFLTGDDDLALALVNLDEVDPDTAMPPTAPDAFLTTFQQYNWTDQDNREGNVPYETGELAGLLRQLAASGTDVRALYWDQMLEQLDEPENGEANNEAMVGILSRAIASRFCPCALDRSGRAFGAFHQKAAVIMRPPSGGGARRSLAYLGGIDLARGRWDSFHHMSQDADRQGNTWHDVHVKIWGDAVIDVYRNFKQRWDALRHFKSSGNALGVPKRDAGLDLPIDPAPLEYPLAHDMPPPNAFVQINRTIPPKCIHKDVPPPPGAGVEEQYPYVDNAGELGSLESYRNAIQRARKFIHIEDQYFFCSELALEIHDALVKPDGPQFVILVLPKVLGEFEAIDNLLYDRRKIAIDVLRYGAHDLGPGEGPDKLRPKTAAEAAEEDMSDRIVICSPVNEKGEPVYVHSKHIIVDDVWMSIGSTNMGYRSMTYDFEINAAIVGNELFEGGTAVVRAQRMELWRQLLHLPEAHVHLLEDAAAGFEMFQKLADRFQNLPDAYIEPFDAVRFAKLDPDWRPPIAETTGAVVLTPGTPEYFWLVGNVLDPDGRTAPANAGMRSLVKYKPTEFVKVLLVLDTGCADAVRVELEGGAIVTVKILVSVFDEGQETAPAFYHSLAVTLDADGAPGLWAGDFVFVPFTGRCRIRAEVVKQAAADAPEETLPHQGEIEVSEIPWDSKPVLEQNLVIE